MGVGIDHTQPLSFIFTILNARLSTSAGIKLCGKRWWGKRHRTWPDVNSFLWHHQTFQKWPKLRKFYMYFFKIFKFFLHQILNKIKMSIHISLVFKFQKLREVKGAFSGLRQSLTTECSLKMIKNAFYFTLTLFQMGHFGVARWWGMPKRPTFPKICHKSYNDETWFCCILPTEDPKNI